MLQCILLVLNPMLFKFRFSGQRGTVNEEGLLGRFAIHAHHLDIVSFVASERLESYPWKQRLQLQTWQLGGIRRLGEPVHGRLNHFLQVRLTHTKVLNRLCTEPWLTHSTLVSNNKLLVRDKLKPCNQVKVAIRSKGFQSKYFKIQQLHDNNLTDLIAYY